MTGPAEMVYDRFEACLKTGVTVTLFTDKGAVIGTGTLTIRHSIELSATSSTIDDTISVTLANTTGEVVAVAVRLDAACTSRCVATTTSPWSGARTLTRGQSASGRVAYQDNLAKGEIDNTRTRYDAFITVPGAIPINPTVSWDSVTDIRCDNAVGNTSGCVYPLARPDFQVSVEQYGAAAITYVWAQSVLPDGWGDGTPLRRLADPTVADGNRRRTCDSTFVPFPSDVVVDDTCDEFPFAATYEGGTPGGLCADIVALLENGFWEVYEANPDKPVRFTEKCVRGHVPLADNRGVGGDLGRFAPAQRLLDLDKYSVTIVD